MNFDRCIHGKFQKISNLNFAGYGSGCSKDSQCAKAGLVCVDSDKDGSKDTCGCKRGFNYNTDTKKCAAGM